MSDALRLGGACLSLLGLGLAMGTSPSTYAIVLRLLESARRPAASVRLLLLGVALGAVALLLVFRVVDPATITAPIEDRAVALLVRRGVDLLAGLVLLVAAAVELRRSRGPRRPPQPPADAHRRSPRRLVALGFADSVIGVSGMATMYVTGRVIASTSRDPLVDAGLLAVFLAAVVGPYLLLSWAWERFPGFARAMTRLLDRLAAIDLRPVLVLALAIAGIVFLALGVWGHGALGELPRR